jgi:N-ethylmaleimide reductase
MAALTRLRADPKTGIPSDLHKEYYSQRAGSAGFNLTECTQVVPEGTSFLGSCGIHSEEQVQGWKNVTDAVHAKGGRIVLQIWHSGRAAHPDLHDGKQSISSSANPIREDARTAKGKVPHSTPKAMEEEDFKYITHAFRKGAENAKKAGFDGLQLHCANGYLMDQFLRDSPNQRKDKYGGSIENRCRFPLEIIDQLIEVFGADRVGVKVSPLGRFQDMSDSEPIALYSYFFEELNKRKVAFVEVMEKGEGFAGPSKEFHVDPETQMKGTVAENLKPFFKGIYIANNNFTYESANTAIEKGWADAVTFGRMFISNPDLVSRLQNGWPLNEPSVETFYFGGEKGYTDYPFYKL